MKCEYITPLTIKRYPFFFKFLNTIQQYFNSPIQEKQQQQTTHICTSSRNLGTLGQFRNCHRFFIHITCHKGKFQHSKTTKDFSPKVIGSTGRDTREEEGGGRREGAYYLFYSCLIPHVLLSILSERQTNILTNR